MMKKWSMHKVFFVFFLLVSLTVSSFAYRAYRVWNVATDAKAQVRYLIENNETIGESPAAEVFSSEYLDSFFGYKPELADALKRGISKGVSDTPALNLGAVAAMIVTYQEDEEGKLTDVIANIAGDFPLTERKPQMHRDGYFDRQIQKDLWHVGNSTISMLGRDMLFFGEEDAIGRYDDVYSAMLGGNIMPMVDYIKDPLHYNIVFPDPRGIVPNQLRRHIQAVFMQGYLSHQKGRCETILLCRSARSAKYTMKVLSDMTKVATAALKTKWKGVELEKAWGPHIETWWAYEMVKNLEDTTLVKDDKIITMAMDYDRVMINVILKTLERLGRDIAQIQDSMSRKTDPRIVDEKLQARKPLHYWSDPHRWGPDWPIKGDEPVDRKTVDGGQ